MIFPFHYSICYSRSAEWICTASMPLFKEALEVFACFDSVARIFFFFPIMLLKYMLLYRGNWRNKTFIWNILLYFQGLCVSAQCTCSGLIFALFPRFPWRNSLRIHFQFSRRLFSINKAKSTDFPSSRTRKAYQKTVDSTISQLFTTKFISPCSRYAWRQTSTSDPDLFLPAMTFRNAVFKATLFKL